jgi:hypothetical protein
VEDSDSSAARLDKAIVCMNCSKAAEHLIREQYKFMLSTCAGISIFWDGEDRCVEFTTSAGSVLVYPDC